MQVLQDLLKVNGKIYRFLYFDIVIIIINVLCINLPIPYVF